MKKILLFIILVIPFKVNASTIVMDMDTNRVLYGSSIHEKKLIASTSKIMTSLVVINNIDINTKVIIGSEILKSTGSNIYIEVGEEIKVIDLLYGLLLRSGNDAAIALSYIVGGSEEGFATLMNETAKSLGMNDTNFINASGLEDENGNGNTSTAYDMALLMSEAMKNKIFKEITKTKKRIVKTNYKIYEWINKNKLLYNYKYTTGGKTGYTKKAKRTLVTSASKDNKNLVVVTLNEVNDFFIHESLYDEYFKKYKLVNIIDSKYYLKKEGLCVLDDFNMLLSDSEIKKVKLNVTYTNDLIDRVGFVTVTLDNHEYYKENIYLKEKKKEKKKFLFNFFRF